MANKMISLTVVERFMDATEFANFKERYANAKQKFGYRGREVTEKDREIFAKFKAGTKLPILAKEYGCSISKIQTSILLACK